MSWRINITANWANILRFVARSLLITNGILAAVTLTYVNARFLWHLVRYLDRTLFSSEW